VVREALHGLQRTRPSFAWIGFAAPGGRIEAATRSHLEGHDASGRPWFAAAAEGPTAGDVYEANLLADLLGTNRAGAASQFIDISVPVVNGAGEVIGALGAHLSWTWAAELRDGVLASRPTENNERILVLDRAGRVILGGALGSRPFGDAPDGGSAVRDTPEGRMLAAFAPTRGRGDYAGLGWTVVVERPLDAALAPANRLNIVLFVLGSLVAAIGLAAFAVFARQISRPIDVLTGAVDRIGRDPEARTIPRLHGSREIAALSAAVRSLLRRVGSAQDQVRHARRLAETDALTGLLNRRAFLPLASEALHGVAREGRSHALLMVDIDHFKRINDTHGHAVGDDVIRAVGTVLRQTVRASDEVARFGGEEFVALLRDVELEAAGGLAERACDAIRALTVTSGDTAVACTASIGVAALRSGDSDVETAIARADHALYRAKAGGRDQMCIASPDGASDVPKAA
jgi:diguanylate cyclase (GGDEF)-like protein